MSKGKVGPFLSWNNSMICLQQFTVALFGQQRLGTLIPTCNSNLTKIYSQTFEGTNTACCCQVRPRSQIVFFERNRNSNMFLYRQALFSGQRQTQKELFSGRVEKHVTKDKWEVQLLKNPRHFQESFSKSFFKSFCIVRAAAMALQPLDDFVGSEDHCLSPMNPLY